VSATAASLVCRGVRGLVWAGFGQTQDPNHIRYSGLGEVKRSPVILMGEFGQTH